MPNSLYFFYRKTAFYRKSAKLDKPNMLERFPLYIRSTAIENQQVLLEQLKQRELYKPTGRPLFSASMIHFALDLRHTSIQAYKLLLENFQCPPYHFW